MRPLPEATLIEYIRKYCGASDGLVCDYRSRHLATRISTELQLPLFSLDEARNLMNPVQVLEFCGVSSSLISDGHIVALRMEARMRKAKYPYIFAAEVV
jgi:hypothetical protein